MAEENVAGSGGQGGGFADVGSMGPDQIDLEIASIRSDKDFQAGPGSSLGGNRKAEILQARLEKLYQAKFPEGDRQKTPEPDRGLYDLARTAGLGTPEKIKAEGEQGRQEIENEALERQRTEAETTLRMKWGSDKFEEKRGYAHAIRDAYLTSEADKEFLAGPAGNDPDLIDKLADLGEYVSTKYGSKATPGKKESK